MLSFDEAEQFREKLRRQIEESRKLNNYGQCAQINPNYCGATYQPAYRPAYEPPKNDQEIYYKSIGVENQKLREEKQHYILQLQSLQNEVRVLREENYNLKQKIAKKKVVPDMVAATKTNINTIYQSIINWFNT
jgi:hypothetical protein